MVVEGPGTSSGSYHGGWVVVEGPGTSSGSYHGGWVVVRPLVLTTEDWL